MPKPRIAIFDLTDCEGCECTLLTLGDAIEKVAQSVEFVNFRVGTSAKKAEHFDVAFIEGYVMNDEEADYMRQIRENSSLVVALGSCAVTGGVPGIVPDEKREAWFKEMYGNKQPRICAYVKPLDQVIKVDVYMDGCPVPKDQFALALAALLAGRAPNPAGMSVCSECKAKGNHCVLLDRKPCLGGVTRSGCNATCPSHSKPCVGCFRLLSGANLEALIKIFRDQIGMTDQEIYQKFQMYSYCQPEFKATFY
jgi:sulfhydrogenase subunit delta